MTSNSADSQDTLDLLSSLRNLAIEQKESLLKADPRALVNLSESGVRLLAKIIGSPPRGEASRIRFLVEEIVKIHEKNLVLIGSGLRLSSGILNAGATEPLLYGPLRDKAVEPKGRLLHQRA